MPPDASRPTVRPPNRISLETAHALAARVDALGELPEELDLDLRYLSFVEPAGIVALANVLEWLRRHGVRVTLKVPRTNNEAVRYLDDSGFFLHYAGARLSPRSRRRATTVPLSLVTYAESFQWLRSTLTSWLAGRLHMSSASLGLLEVCLGEVFNNIQDHSGVGVGAVFAQHYPKLDAVRVAVSDFGSGIPDRVRTKEPALDDPACLLRAMEPGFTTRSSPGNRGAGLDILADSVLQVNGGRLTILSGRGVLRTSPSADGPVYRTREARVSYPGTLIALRLRTDTIEPETPEEDLLW